MEKYKRYSGVIIFVLAVVLLAGVMIASTKYLADKYIVLKNNAEELAQTLQKKQTDKVNIEKKLAKLHNSILSSQKKIYSPVEDKLGDDTLFFTLYSDLIEMVHSNSIKIKSIDYQYNPSDDIFTKQNGKYFVCDVTMELVSNYINLGKLIQDIYQYPYYIRMNNIEVLPYPKDKKILLSKMTVRLYAHTSKDSILE